MIKEYSYGAVVCKVVNNMFYTLIEYMTLGHVSIPKGHIEKGETPIECAKREIKEETNLDVEIDTSFSRTITYSPRDGISKDVTFYLSFLKGSLEQELIIQPSETIKLEWVTFDEAIEKVTHESDKQVLKDFKTELEKRYKNIKV